MTKESAPSELARVIRKILAGGVTKDLTRTPHETLPTASMKSCPVSPPRKTVTEIAEELSLSATIRTYRALGSWKKLGVNNSAEIVQDAIQNGL
jgi:hypothetical protein